MEPISRTLQQSTQFFLVGIYCLLALVPLSFTLAQYSIQLDSEFLSPIFFLLLLRSVLFSALQASLSVVSIGLFVFFFGVYFHSRTHSSTLRRLIELVGFLSFSLSPTLVALSLLMTSSHIGGELPAGILAIVLCHFLLNAVFLGSFFLRRLDRFFNGQGEDLALTLKSWGATPLQKSRYLWWPIFFVDFKSWAPQVFLWSFMSFAPIVLLSAGPHQNTPEVLLYYSLLNDPSGSRLLVIFLLTASLSFFLNRYAQQAKPAHEESVEFMGPTQTATQTHVKILIFFLLTLLLSPFLYSVLTPLIYSSGISSELFNVLVPSGIIFLSTFLIAILLGCLSLFGDKELKVVSFCNFISAPMILMGSLSFLSESQAPYPLISLGAFLAVFPWFYRQLRFQVERIPEDLKNLSLSLGLKNFSYFKLCLWPLTKSSILRLSLLTSLWSLGEYTFSKALLNRSSTLALFIEEKLRRYQFNEAAAALSLSLIISFIVVFVFLWKGEKRVAL